MGNGSDERGTRPQQSDGNNQETWGQNRQDSPNGNGTQNEREVSFETIDDDILKECICPNATNLTNLTNNSEYDLPEILRGNQQDSDVSLSDTSFF